MIRALMAWVLVAASLFTSSLTAASESEGSVSGSDVEGIRSALSSSLMRNSDKTITVDFDVPQGVARAAAADVFRALGAIGGPHHPLTVSHQETTGVMLVRGDAETADRAAAYITEMARALRRSFKISISFPDRVRLPFINMDTTTGVTGEADFLNDGDHLKVSATVQRLNTEGVLLRLTLLESVDPHAGGAVEEKRSQSTTVRVPQGEEAVLDGPFGLVRIEVQEHD